jgi:uncharacterized protein (TIGR03546 family)
VYFLLKTLKSFFKIFNSLAAPWQVFLGSLFGVLLGFLPILPIKHGFPPAPLGLAILFAGIVINVHLGSMLLLMAVFGLIAKGLHEPATKLGEAFSGLAKASADIPFLRLSLWSHTTYLGFTLMGLVLAPIVAALMWWATVAFRTKLRDKLIARRKLVAAGKVGGHWLVLKVVCWFFDL